MYRRFSAFNHITKYFIEKLLSGLILGLTSTVKLLQLIKVQRDGIEFSIISLMRQTRIKYVLLNKNLVRCLVTTIMLQSSLLCYHNNRCIRKVGSKKNPKNLVSCSVTTIMLHSGLLCYHNNRCIRKVGSEKNLKNLVSCSVTTIMLHSRLLCYHNNRSIRKAGLEKNL